MDSFIDSSDFGEFEEEYFSDFFYFYIYLFKKICFIYKKMVEKRKYCFFGNSVQSAFRLKVELFQTTLIIIRIVAKAKFMDST